MNVNDLTIGEAKALVAMFSGGATQAEPRAYDLAIVVVDRGFVYIGYVETRNEMCIIRECRNIRRWGTERGLAQLVNDGPTSESRIDPAMKSVHIPMRAVISIINVEKSAWKQMYA